MRKICPICNQEFNALKRKQIFCSNTCRWKSIKLKDAHCIVCWKLFHPSKSWVKACSKECWYKSMSLWDKECLFCWKKFKPAHSYNKYCSRECSSKSHIFLGEIECIICWQLFRQKTSKQICCSKHCWQIYNWNKKSDENKRQTIFRLTNRIEVISKINHYYWDTLNNIWYKVDMEFNLWYYSYDLKIWNILIEINPFAFHNSTWVPNKFGAKIKDKMYHYNKAKYAVDNWYNIIMVWDWMNENEVVDLIKNIKSTKIKEPRLHWYNPKTKEHLIDKNFCREDMINQWYLEIYDWWENYI